MKEIVFEYKDVISNAEFIIDLLELVGTNVAPILANLYLAKLEKSLTKKPNMIQN